MAADTQKQKQEFLEQFQANISQIAMMIERAASFTKTFIDRGYDPAANDPITDADLAPFGVVTYDMGAAINLQQQLWALWTAQQTVPSEAYHTAANKWRRV